MRRGARTDTRDANDWPRHTSDSACDSFVLKGDEERRHSGRGCHLLLVVSLAHTSPAPLAFGFLKRTISMTKSRAGIRSRRDGWARAVKVMLTERDIQILFALWVCGVLRTCDLLRLFFGARPTANDRMQKLKCA